ncbi:cytosine permease [Acetobacteraceae bacterium KSS8]|uniref:Cytosine permease n=1 Tax=Endosaccharibacter trunci TaxID=2812733 RepID=A0ABT1W7R3_9PROT|nr:cytosine permease [Acetobacteraceae bacterium KSS8]
MSLEHEEYTGVAVPLVFRGSAWRVFFIVTGTVCGLPTYVLSAQIFHALGSTRAVGAILAGTALVSLLAAFSCFLGAHTGMSLALLSERAFGRFGARIVKLLLAISLIGWFGANIGLLGMSAAGALHEQFGFSLARQAISFSMGVLIMVVACIGATGLERLGQLVIPAAAIGVTVAIAHVVSLPPHRAVAIPLNTMTFSGAVSAIVGSYIVGIIIQPDYSRFVRSPSRAVLAAVVSLGAIYPALMVGAGYSALVVGRPDLVTVLTAIGLGIPALCVLLLSVWIDATASLYSASLAMANQIASRRIVPCVIAAGCVGLAIDLSGIADSYVRFLLLLGIALPPVAVIIAVDGLFEGNTKLAVPVLRPAALLGWAAGTVMGILCEHGVLTLTSVPVFDSLIVTAAIAFASGGLQAWTRCRARRCVVS